MIRIASPKRFTPCDGFDLCQCFDGIVLFCSSETE